MLNKSFNKKELNKLQTMTYKEKKSVLFKMPIKMVVPMYLNYCTRNELIELLKEWDILLSYTDEQLKTYGKPKKVKKRYKELIPKLLQGLKKSHKLFFVPKLLRGKYGF